MQIYAILYERAPIYMLKKQKIQIFPINIY